MTLIILRMLGSAVCIIAIMLVFYLLDKRTALGRCRQEYRQLLYGLVFSVLTVSLLLTPEESMRIQQVLNSDIAMIFDECTPFPASHTDAASSMRLSLR